MTPSSFHLDNSRLICWTNHTSSDGATISKKKIAWTGAKAPTGRNVAVSGDAEKYTPLLMEHFRRWGLEVHAGSYHPFKGSKTELLFCARPLSTYQDPSTCENTDMTDLILPNGRFVPVVTKFKYLGSYISSDGSDTIDGQSRMAKARVRGGLVRA